MDVRFGKIEFKLTRLRLWGGVFLGLYLAHVLMPIYWRRAGADACTFGSVTNEQYREYRRAAEWELLIAQFWMSGDEKKRARRVADAVETIGNGTTSLFHRLAIMHAVMRSLNGQHWQTNFRGDKEQITHDARKIWEYDDTDSQPRIETYIGHVNKAKTGEDPGFLLSVQNGGDNRPIWYLYSYSTWGDRFNPFSLFRPFDTPYRVSFSPRFLDQEFKLGQTKKDADSSGLETNLPPDSIQNTPFDVSTPGPFVPNFLDGFPPRNKWKDSMPYGPCPVVPSIEWASKYIDQHKILNMRP